MVSFPLRGALRAYYLPNPPEQASEGLTTWELKLQTLSNKGHLNWGLMSKLTCIQELTLKHFNLEVSEETKKGIKTHIGLPGLIPITCSVDFLLYLFCGFFAISDP